MQCLHHKGPTAARRRGERCIHSLLFTLMPTGSSTPVNDQHWDRNQDQSVSMMFIFLPSFFVSFQFVSVKAGVFD